MKILRKTHLVKRRQIERTRTERKVLSVVNHPFIMKLHYAFQSPDKLYLVLDYCPGGELFFHLSRFRRFPERVARFYAAELLLAIGHLHKRGIIYSTFLRTYISICVYLANGGAKLTYVASFSMLQEI
jgi:serum/glucocorticoid-regulated kinase 2